LNVTIPVKERVAEINHFICLIKVPRETMKHATHLPAILAQNLESIVPSVALMITTLSLIRRRDRAVARN